MYEEAIEEANEILEVLSAMNDAAVDINNKLGGDEDTMGAMVRLLSMQVNLLVMLVGDRVIKASGSVADLMDKGGCDCPECTAEA